MNFNLSLVEGKTSVLQLSGDTIGQLRIMNELYPSGLDMTEIPDGIRVKPRSIGHYHFRDGTKIDVTPAMPDESLVSEKTLMKMMYTIFNMKESSDTINLFEFFVKVFVKEVGLLMRKGMRSAYTQIQGNENVFKGRLLVSENIRENLVHKERIYVEYELFTQDRPENRVIKSTLEVLLKRSCDDRNLRDIKVLLSGLEEIPSSSDVQRDLAACRIDRNMSDYVSPLMWCSIFIGDNRGSFALIMDSNNVLDAFVAKRSSHGRDGSFSTRCTIKTIREDVSISLVKIDWSYRSSDGYIITDSEKMYRSAYGYSVIPSPISDYSFISCIASRILGDDVC